MPGLADLFGKNGAIEQLLLWGVVNQVIGASLQPALQTLTQDVAARHPVAVIDPATAADLAARGIITVQAAERESARSGLDAARFGQLLAAHTVRLPPGDVATAILRSYLTKADGEAIVKPQGVTPSMLATLTDLAGDAPGPQQLAEALRRGLIPRGGRGPAAVSFEQGISESRLHDKWTPVIAELAAQLLSPADAAAAVVRNFLPHDAAAKVAAEGGVSGADFETLIRLSGDAPGPQQLAEALRRGLIPEQGTGADSTAFSQGIAEGRLADKWTDVIKGLAQLWPTPTDALDAALKGQITDAEGKRLYQLLGGDLQFYPWLLASIGDSPTPLEAAALAARGIIAEQGLGPAVLSYDQAVKESRYRNKWGAAYRKLAEHIPPPSTIVSMLAHRQLTTDQAHQLLLQNDMAQDLAAAYIAEAEYEAISDYRGLTESAVVDMYVGHVIDRGQAVQLLAVLHVSEQAAGLLLDYADMRYAIDSINRSVQRIATLFTSRKIGTQTAADALGRLGISPAAVEQIISDLEIQAAANVKTLTAAEIFGAFKYQIMSQDEAISDLGALGYSPYDAWVYMSTQNKAPLPDKPPRVVAPPVGAVIPGVT